MVRIIHLMMEEKALYLWQKLMLLIVVFIMDGGTYENQ